MTILSIIIASVLGFVWGSVWYMSPFGRAWRDAKPMDPKDDHTKYSNSKKYMMNMFGTGFVITFLVAYVLEVFIMLSGMETLVGYLQVSLLACFGFVVTTKFSDLMYTNTPPFWGKRAQTVFIVDVVYYVVLFAILAATLYFL